MENKCCYLIKYCLFKTMNCYINISNPRTECNIYNEIEEKVLDFAKDINVPTKKNEG